MSNRVEELLIQLRSYKQIHIEISKSVFHADNTLSGMDLLISTTLNRSLCLIRGLCDLLEGKNFIVAAPLLRLQIDNCIRLSAAWLVDDPDRFALEVLNGIPIKHKRDKSGQPMSDAYLVRKLAEQYPWVSKVYKHTSGYVHLSDKHFFNAMQVDSGTNDTVVIKISGFDQFVPESSYIELMVAFKTITNILLEYVYGWACSKSGTILQIPGITGESDQVGAKVSWISGA